MTRDECVEWKRDAERYRWLRDNWTSIVSHMDSPFEIRFEVMPSKWGNFGPEVIDAAIDDAIRAVMSKDKP